MRFGRTAAWTSDIGPHWLAPEFCRWTGYGRLWKNILKWLTDSRSGL
ncbi:MAG: glutamine amidotransferase [Paracoccaceae bacterium]